MATTRLILQVLETYQKARITLAQTVAEFSNKATNVEVLHNAGCMQLLRPFLLDSVPNIQQTAAIGLSLLAGYSEELGEAIVHENILIQLVYSLREQNRYNNRAAASVLIAIAKHSAPLAQACVDAGAVQPLVLCLEEFDQAVTEVGAWALGHIARHNSDLAQYVVDAGAVALLVLCVQAAFMMANVASSSQTPIVRRHPGFVQLNDSVWELYNPSSIAPVPEVEVIFFHGLQLDHYEEAFWRTWLSRDNTVVWPRDWLTERFPKARILSVSYDSRARKHQGEPDPYVITENLIHDMIQSDGIHVGQNRPVVLVGHSFGGIVIKQFVLGCIRMKDELNHVTCQLEVDRINNFLRNCRGIFYYSTPHLGSRIADYADLIPGIKFNVPLMKLLKTLSTETGRINESFAHARGNFGIKTRAIGESLNTNYMGLSAKVVEDASARYDIDVGFYTAPNANHFDICKPKDSKACAIFKQLVTFVGDIVESNETTVGENGDECQGLPNYPVELDSRARGIEKLLLGKAVIGISGMGGIGKTTVAKKVYNDISRNFDYTCFAENVKGVQIRDLEDSLLRRFHKSGTRMEGARRQWSDFKGRKTMIVLDDVDSTNQISVLPKLHHFGEGSRIILTSRDGGIFKYFDEFEFYEVGFLKDDEAKKLFCQHAFGIQEIPNYATNLKENVEAVVEKCNGLPLTLEVNGRYLRNEGSPRVWEETIDKLRQAESIDGEQNDRVWASLRVSYEALAKEEQDMFLEAGTYFFGEKLDVALAAWSSISANSESRWKNLVRRSMVKEDQDKTVWVHEHLRDLSWTLMKGDIVSDWSEEGDELVRQLNAKQVNADTKILKLRYPRLDRTLQLQRIAELKELKYLELDGVNTKGSGKNLSSTLSLLRWKGSRSAKSQLPITLIPMTSLAVLELGYWDVPKGFPKALSNLTNLRHLSLSRLKGLDRLPENFGNLSRLKYLGLDGLRLSSLPKSFGNLAALEELCITNCKLLECLPDSFSLLSSLRQFFLCECLGLKELGDSFGILRALEDLNLDFTSIERLPDSFSQLSGLERLSLACCKSLKESGDSFGNLSALKYLDLGYTCIERLPESFGCLSALEELHCEFDQARLLPDNFCLLTSLRKLSLKSASLERLPDTLGELVRLEELDLRVDHVSALPTSLGQLASLQNLDIRSQNLEKLPDSLGMLSSLESLNLFAGKLESLPQSIGRLRSLRTMELEVPCIRCLPESMNELSSLRKFSFHSDGHDWVSDHFEHLPFPSPAVVLEGSESVPQDIGRLSSLQDLTLKFENVKSLPAELGELSSLQVLTISCERLESLPDSLSRLSSLRELYLEWLISLNSLPDSLGCLSSLRELHLKWCHSLKSLPDSLGRPSSSQRALPHGAVRNDKEPSFQTPATGANASNLTVQVLGCPILDKLRMRRSGWVLDKGFKGVGELYQKRPEDVPDNPPLGCVVIQLTWVLCYIAISFYLLRKFYYAFQHK